jgi:hypothetical protein
MVKMSRTWVKRSELFVRSTTPRAMTCKLINQFVYDEKVTHILANFPIEFVFTYLYFYFYFRLSYKYSDH